MQRFASIFNIDIAGVGISIDPPDGIADSGKLELDLPELFAAVGHAAKAANKGFASRQNNSQIFHKVLRERR